MKALALYVLAVGLAALGYAQVQECKTVSWQAGRMFCEPLPVTTTTTTTLPPACVNQKLNGLTVDKCVHLMPTTLPKPAYLEAYVDPAFGTTIRRISAVSESEGENAIVRPLYSTMQHWNADESLMILYQRGRKWGLLDGKTYAFKKWLVLRSPTDIEQINWVGTDFLVYPSNYNAIPELMAHQVSTGVNTVLKNFSGPPTNCPTGDWGNLLRMGADPMRMSWEPESHIIGLNCGAAKFAYDLTSQTVKGVVQLATSPNAPMPTPSGLRFWLDGRSYDATLATSFSLNLASVVEHASLGRLEDGSEFYASVVFGGANEGNLVTQSMTAPAQPKVIVGPASGWPTPRPGTHISAVAHKAPGVMTVSIIGVPGRNAVLDQEILWVKAGQVYRVGHHRSLAGEGPHGYFSEPHASPSVTGTRILFASDWGGGPTVDSYVVELPSYIP